VVRESTETKRPAPQEALSKSKQGSGLLQQQHCICVRVSSAAASPATLLPPAAAELTGSPSRWPLAATHSSAVSPLSWTSSRA
jgi:hypothetical protein